MKLPSVPHFKEYFTTLCVTMSLMACGVHIGWPSPTLPKLKSDDSPIKINGDEGSWIVAIFLIGCTLGPIPAGLLVNRIGRKTTLIMTGIPFLVCWVMILFARTVPALYIARFIGGIAYGAVYTIAPMYLGEIASDKIRGALGIFITTMAKFGILLVYCVGPYVSYEVLPYILMVPLLIFLATYFIIPETPYFYLMKHREEDAMASLRYLRGHEDTKLLQLELDKMQLSVKNDQENKADIKELFNTKGNRKALLILFGCFFGQQFCGSQAVIAYAQEIFAEADGALGPSESAIVLAVVQLMVAFISSTIVDRIGRRPLLLGSSAGVTITSAVIGGYFYMKYYLENDVSSISWLPINAMLVYIVSYTIGLGTVPYVLIGEYFPTNVKALALVIGGIFFSGCSVIVTKLYQIVSDAVGTYVTFWSFSFLTFLSFLFILITLPETKGKSLVEIQQHLNEKKLDVAAA